MIAALLSCKEKEKSEQTEEIVEQTQEVVKVKVEEVDAITKETEYQSDWEVLFDGTSMDAWKGYLRENVPDTWKIEDDAMVFYPPTDRPKGESYNIVTRKDYKSFVLSLEWRISEKGNSGIFWAVVEDERFPEAYETGPEIQVLDNSGASDTADMTHQAGALYDMVAPSEDVTKVPGEWNTCVLTVNYTKNIGWVVLNDVKIVEFTPYGKQWNDMVADSKFAEWAGFAKTQTGKIGLQDHGDIVAYRNIKIRELW